MSSEQLSVSSLAPSLYLSRYLCALQHVLELNTTMWLTSQSTDKLKACHTLFIQRVKYTQHGVPASFLRWQTSSTAQIFFGANDLSAISNKEKSY